MFKLIYALLLAVPLSAFAAGGAVLPVEVNLGDKPSLQRGARLFVNYCLSCHSAQYMRYNRMGADLGISDELLRENLMFAASKSGETMRVAMFARDAEKWFGTSPPDLSVVTRSRGADWLYTYLLTFFKDDNPARPSGVNNLVFKDVGMPNVLWRMQGIQVLNKAERPPSVASEHVVGLHPTKAGIDMVSAVETEDGQHLRVTDSLTVSKAGERSPPAFRRDIRDLVNFLVYVGEPAKMVRYKIGVWVMIFLIVFFGFAYKLKQEYWKDVH